MGLYEEREETDAGDDRSHNLDAGAVEQNDHHREDPQRGAIKNPQKSGSKGDRRVADEHIPIQIFFLHDKQHRRKNQVERKNCVSRDSMIYDGS